jgi:hypothetical protein
MITITLKIQTFKRNHTPSKAYKIIYLGDNTYVNKFAKVSNETEILSVSTGSECLGIVMEETKYISQYYRVLPSGKR